MTDLNIPDAVVAAGWHEFRYPRPAIDEPSDAFKRGLDAAAPLIVAAELERLLGSNDGLQPYEWAGQVLGRVKVRLAELPAWLLEKISEPLNSPVQVRIPRHLRPHRWDCACERCRRRSHPAR